MKKLLLALCLALTCATLRADNLLKNASYEKAGSSEDTADSWSRWGDWINRETSWSPTHSGQGMIGYHHWQITDDKNSGLWQDVANVKPGQKFKFSVFVWADKPDAGKSAEKVELRLETIRNGKEVMIESVSTPCSEFEGDSKWHELSVTGTTPETNIRVLMVVTPATESRAGAVKFDDADLELVK